MLVGNVRSLQVETTTTLTNGPHHPEESQGHHRGPARR